MKAIYVAMQGYGRHEVIIESPPNRQIVTMSSQEVEIIIETYHRRHVDFMQEHRNMMIMIFRTMAPTLERPSSIPTPRLS
jgi:UDPglucose--hexose-1-phosphate uridylyltransferase